MPTDSTFREKFENKMSVLKAMSRKYDQSAQNARGEARSTDGEVNLPALIAAYERAFIYGQISRELLEQAESMYLEIRFHEGFDAGEVITEVETDIQGRAVPEMPTVGRFTFGDIVTAYASTDTDREHRLVVEIANPYDAGTSEMSRVLLSTPPKGAVYAYTYEADLDGELLKVRGTIALASIEESSQEQRRELVAMRNQWEEAR